MNVLGVILARAGSLGLKDKHLLPLLGQPVISYTFEHARAAGRLTRAVVSSDCPQVLRLARQAMFETIDRPAELATADASVQAVCLHAMETVESRSPGFRADAVVVLYGNVPVRPDGIIDQCVELLERTGCDSARSLCPVGKWHPAWMHRLGTDAVMSPLVPNSIHRRQDLEPVFLHDGAAVAVTRAALLRARTNPEDPHAFFGTDRRGVVGQMRQAIEVDGIRDLYWAEAALRDRANEAVRQPRLAS